ncbi:caspase-7-like [Dendronephthya gigantea]|uniref:caspase-7-like n=1 Tax=Dendronephthya gigantea TaxID=151771 RepID=UPI00106DBA8D|nr:caspase-7-like [Dendronephthya gigantea]
MAEGSAKYNINVVNVGSGTTIIGDNQNITIAMGTSGHGQPSVTSVVKSHADEDGHHINRGYALIIHNMKNFRKLPSREGSEKDVGAIKRFCRKAGLTLDDLKENCTVSEIRTHCRKLASDNKLFSNYDGFVCFILSHGNRYGIYGVDEDIIKVKDIVSYFKENKDLLGKPKLFFIQACRSEGSSPGLPSARGKESDGVSTGHEIDSFVEDDGDYEKMLLPPESSDILLAHSTIDGEQSYRDIRTGSWFIQTLMKQFEDHAQTLHVLDILTKVNGDMSGNEFAGYRQMPIQVSTLRKSVYFKINT